MHENRGRALRDREVTITGRLASMSRDEAVSQIRAGGGRHAEVPTDDTAFLVIGGDGPPLGPDGRPTHALRRARDLRNLGHPIEVLDEVDFLPMIKTRKEAAGLQHLYTIAQLSRILDEPIAKIRAWVRQDLIRPVKVQKRLCYFEFGQVAMARRLQQLTLAGITPNRIRRSLAQISEGFGKPALDLSHLEAITQDRAILVRFEDGRLADPHGQLLLDFNRGGGTALAEPPIPTMKPREETAEGWFRIGLSAEADGELSSAIEAYQRALRMGTPQPRYCFNLGNTLYAMDRNAEAAACFTQATEIDSDYVEAWNNLGNALKRFGNCNEAITAYRRALAISPHYKDAHYNLAETMASQGNLAGARQHWVAYLYLDPTSQWALMVRERLAELR